MEDLSEYVFKGDQEPDLQQTFIFLDGLARVHAKFWNDPRLMEPKLGLCNVISHIDMVYKGINHDYRDGSLGVIPEWLYEGRRVLEELWIKYFCLICLGKKMTTGFIHMSGRLQLLS